MKYIVEVREPVPSNLDEIAGKVAASFRISNDKALVLLRRAPGAMTKAVSEREADVVAGIFERAGLQVVKRPVEEPPARPEPVVPDTVEGAAPGGEPSQEPSSTPAAGGEGDETDGVREDAHLGAAHLEPEAAPEAGEPDLGGWDARAGTAGGELADDRHLEESTPDASEFEAMGLEGASAPEADAEPAGDVWDRPIEASDDQPVDAFSRREGFEEEGDLDWGAPAGAAAGEEGGERPLEAEAGLPPEEGIELDEDAPLPSAGDAAFGAGLEGGADALDGGPTAGARARQQWAEEAAGAAGGSGMSDAMAGAMAGAAEGEGAAADAEALGGAGAAGAAGADAGRSSRTPEMARASQTPETVRRSQTPETMKSTLTRAPADKLHSGGLRRRVALSSILPALLTLVVMAVAMLVTVLPLLRSQQLARATDAARAEASTLEAMTGGLPLDSQTLSTALVDLARGSKAAMGGDGVRLMVVTDATGTPLAGWYGPALTPAALPPSVRQDVAGQALKAVAGGEAGGESFGQSLQHSWSSLLALLGLGTAQDVVAAAPVMSAGQAIGAVVMGVRPVSANALVGNAFLTTVLVGLVPVLIAILVAMGLTRGLRAQITYLLTSADRISHGDFEEPVALDSQDELGQLARAIERMRVSLQEGLERLRNRR